MIHPSNPANHPTGPEKTPKRAKRARVAASGTGTAIGRTVDPVSGRWPYGGFALFRFAVERTPGRPATDAAWAFSVRRVARRAVWIFPAYAIVYGSVTLVGAGDAPFVAQQRPAHLLGWVGALWLGLLAVLAVTGLLVAARSRALATVGLLVGIAGTMLLLPFGGLPDSSATFGTTGQAIALTGGTLYSLGWGLTGLALFRSGAFSQADGVLVMIAAPMLGLGGMFAAALHSLGAMFVLAAGIGVAWRAGRLLPSSPAALTRASHPGAVAARASVGGGSVVPVRVVDGLPIGTTLPIRAALRVGTGGPVGDGVAVATRPATS